MINWFSRFITSSIGQKVIMSLTGIFLIVFLLVHLGGNTFLLHGDGGEAFNRYAHAMTSNPIIKTVSYGLYFFILLHAVQGIVLWRRNRQARGDKRYAVKKDRVVGTSSFSSVYMGSLGTIILVFILIHMYQFWLQMKLGEVPTVNYEGVPDAKDLYSLVQATYENVFFVIFYVVSMIVIGFHLWHGFQSAFQTLGLNHKKYTPLIKAIGKVYSVLIPAGFASIPLAMYFNIV